MDNLKTKSRQVSSLPPIKYNKKVPKFISKESISNKLKLYFKLRASSKITINNPIQVFLPSGGTFQYPSYSPTAADIVMSPRPPLKISEEKADFKFSRLFDDKNYKGKSFLRKTIKATEYHQSQIKSRRGSNPGYYKQEKKQMTMLHRDGKSKPMLNRYDISKSLLENEEKSKNSMVYHEKSKSSIPFLSETLNRVLKDSSKMLFSPIGLMEYTGGLSEDKSKDFKMINEEKPIFETALNSFDTAKEKVNVAPAVENIRRRVIFNRNSKFVMDDDLIFDNVSYSSSNDN
ncbi:hypothetical protein SteCoe_8021 [Stentor coeruleus]|uniref:Uncharacterized protein n=1 Tax=Stentor coeruleus TaxID=5963 RepID=A0A1R2CL57_9CILI|nr:hypothetical protein SteCoe_8021 [Stentor coeruleus]